MADLSWQWREISIVSNHRLLRPRLEMCPWFQELRKNNKQEEEIKLKYYEAMLGMCKQVRKNKALRPLWLWQPETLSPKAGLSMWERPSVEKQSFSYAYDDLSLRHDLQLYFLQPARKEVSKLFKRKVLQVFVVLRPSNATSTLPKQTIQNTACWKTCITESFP